MTFPAKRVGRACLLSWAVAAIVVAPAATSAQRWCLLAPLESGLVRDGAPATRWTRVGSYATAAECETDHRHQERTQRQKEAQQTERSAEWAFHRIVLNALLRSECVPEADPRLALRP